MSMSMSKSYLKRKHVSFDENKSTRTPDPPALSSPTVSTPITSTPSVSSSMVKRLRMERIATIEQLGSEVLGKPSVQSTALNTPTSTTTPAIITQNKIKDLKDNSKEDSKADLKESESDQSKVNCLRLLSLITVIIPILAGYGTHRERSMSIDVLKQSIETASKRSCSHYDIEIIVYLFQSIMELSHQTVKKCFFIPKLN
jgi:hypothetical protein